MERFSYLSDKVIFRTFRLRRKFVQVIEEEASKQGINVSAYLDKILRNSLNNQRNNSLTFTSFRG